MPHKGKISMGSDLKRRLFVFILCLSFAGVLASKLFCIYLNHGLSSNSMSKFFLDDRVLF